MNKKIICAAFTATAGFASAVSINVGVTGTAGGVNNWPAGEAPAFAIDGLPGKYLNFGKVNTGIVVTPSAGSSVATSITLWTANDAVERDPSSYQVFGTNSDVSGGGSYDSSIFTLISSGVVDLPAGRNLTANPLDSANSYTASFANTDAFTSFLVLFPTVKNEGTANSMQIGEIQLGSAGGGIFSPGDTIFGVQAASTIPEPTTGILALLGLAPMLRRRRK